MINFDITNEEQMRNFGKSLGCLLKGGELIELIGDVGVGKTTLVKGIALGLGIKDVVQSPSFTIERNYQTADGQTLRHYDFYRLNDAGIMANELNESLTDKNSINIIEWGGVVENFLPNNRLVIKIAYISETARSLEVSGSEDYEKILGNLK